MREIKFRAWHKAAPMAQWDMIYWALGSGLDRSVFYDAAVNEGAIMQFTGLKDKNGKEIYEGDRLDDGSEIVYLDGSFWLFNTGKWATNDFPLSAWPKFHYPLHRLNTATYAEVIGNIYENP